VPKEAHMIGIVESTRPEDAERLAFYRFTADSDGNFIQLVDEKGEHIQWVARINDDGSINLHTMGSLICKKYGIATDEYTKIVVT
jgi:hypothetical protein